MSPANLFGLNGLTECHEGLALMPPPVAPARRVGGWDDQGQADEGIKTWAQPIPEHIFDQWAGW